MRQNMRVFHNKLEGSLKKCFAEKVVSEKAKRVCHTLKEGFGTTTKIERL